MRRIAREESRAATATLAEAFRDDALLQIVQPQQRRRHALAPWFMARSVEYGLRWGEVWANDDVSAVAVWVPPQSGPISPGRLLRSGWGAMPFRAGLAGSRRFLAATSALEPFHAAVHGPHWYLFTVGVREAVRGKGLGSALVSIGTGRADADGVACYLETGSPANIDLYRGHGFRVVGQVDCQGFTLTGMLRPPGGHPVDESEST